MIARLRQHMGAVRTPDGYRCPFCETFCASGPIPGEDGQPPVDGVECPGCGRCDCVDTAVAG